MLEFCRLRRGILAALAVIVASSVANADPYPADAMHAAVPTVTQPEASVADSLRVVVPCAAGSPGDLLARAVALMLSERLGQQVVVENITASPGNAGVHAGKQAGTSSNAIFLLAASGSDVSPCGQ
jgi:tripartite-type tricarboxylate transporter receptor subunit TctC